MYAGRKAMREGLGRLLVVLGLLPAAAEVKVGDRLRGLGPKGGGLSRERCVGRDTLAVGTPSAAATDVAAAVVVVVVVVVVVKEAVRTGLLSVGDAADAAAGVGAWVEGDSSISSSDTDSI